MPRPWNPIRAEILCKPGPAVPLSSHGKEHLLRKETPAVVVRVEHPEGNLLGAARLDCTGLGVVVVKAKHLDSILALVKPRHDIHYASAKLS